MGAHFAVQRHDQKPCPELDPLLSCRTWLRQNGVGVALTLEAQLLNVSAKSQLATDIAYALGLWTGLTRFLEDGRLELDTKPVENLIRPIALTRKNALLPGHDVGAENWAMLASLVATCKLNGVNPFNYIHQTLRAILDGHPKNQIELLMPWTSSQPSSLAA